MEALKLVEQELAVVRESVPQGTYLFNEPEYAAMSYIYSSFAEYGKAGMKWPWNGPYFLPSLNRKQDLARAAALLILAMENKIAQ